MESYSFQPSFTQRVFISLFKFINKHTPWHKLPPIVGALNLAILRVELQAKNLYDTYVTGAAYGNAIEEPLPEQRFQNARNSDGKFNSSELPRMGCAGMRFGRNFPRQYTQKPTDEELWTPNPRLVSERFMTRKPKGFIPATSLNLLAAAWIQFQIHDWVFHESSDEVFDIPLPPGDSWPHGDGHMTLPRSKPDEVLDPSDIKCPAYKNTNTSWWDGSQIYGSSEVATHALRTKQPDGKLVLTERGREAFIPRGSDGNPLTGFKDNWWIGMEMLHTMFALEHNAICDKLRQSYPSWTGDQIFDKARLVNCALMAKIHTVEWTPAILAHPTLQIGMAANWWGLAGEKLTKMVGRISKTSDVISGIPGSGADQDGVPYSLTEEFTSVYRMHSLLPDKIAFFNAADGKHQTTIPIENTLFTRAQEPLDKGISFADAFYSFGINYPGAITNNNYPYFLQNLQAQDGHVRDLGTVDILRDRERGVPRYNQFRRLLHMPAPTTFEELTGGNLPLARELEDVYGNDIEKVDTLVGCHSELLPEGFGFSDTAFRIFILMASRRLKSDRFIATQWNAETYTPEGFHWVQYTTMKDVLARHYPELGPVVAKSKNVFAPWEKLAASEAYTGIETNAP
ncbi:heme peroxidase [Melanomma pulvis-pyrius CBS 109.77]|uniref:Heme peroxidase n=1 Tax=Melanomma pulvis-pyrius CBS 109.77 TaxID=1314802 RepID=A0A6A6WV37_9PLEO|nr:heme peroxidase [Melanomma pulvis-pyrius CBS 109.77]